MGNKSGRLKKEFPTEDVKAVAKEVLTTFNPAFTTAFGVSMVDVAAARDRSSRGERDESDPEWQLLKPPIASEPLKVGWMVKLGEKTKNWKRRFFVATNRADNFAVYYFEREDQQDRPSKRKGVIYPCGYSVRSLKREEEIKEFGEHVLCLEPRDRRRAWYLRCENELDRSEWKAVLKFSVQKSKAPLSVDPVLRAAFQEAYKRTRRQLGMWGYYAIDRPEEQQLVCLVTQRCEAKIINRKYEEVPVDKDETKVKALIRETLHEVVVDVVASSWRDLKSRVSSRRSKLEDLVGRSLPSILRYRTTRREAIRERTAKHLRPVVRDVARPVVAPVLHAFLKPLYKAHKEAITLFWNTMNEIIDNGLLEKELKAFFKAVRWQNGALLPAFRKIRCLTRGQDLDEEDDTEEHVKLLSGLTVSLPDLIDLMLGVSLWQVEVRFEDSLKKLVSWAVFSFVHAVETSRGRSTPKQCLANTTRAMIHDSKIRARRDLKRLFLEILCPPARRQALTLPAVQDVLRESVLGLPSTSSSGSGVKRTAGGGGGASGRSSGGGGSGGGGGAGAGAGSGGGGASAPVADARMFDDPTSGFADNDWLLDDVLDKVTTTLVSSAIDPICDPVFGRLNKLPGKFGFL